MSSSFENESGIEFNKNINVPASALLRYDPMYSKAELSSGKGQKICYFLHVQTLDVNSVNVCASLFAYGSRKPQHLSLRQGSANFSTKDQILNLFSFVATWSLSQSLIPALELPKQSSSIWKHAGVAMFPWNFIPNNGSKLHFAQGLTPVSSCSRS